METQSVKGTERLAKISRILGVLSGGLLLLAFVFIIWLKISNGDEFKKLALLIWAAYSFLGSLIFGIPGVITGIIALRRNRTEGDNPQIKRIATVGLVLSGLGIMITLLTILYVWLSAPQNPPPNPVTPIPPTSAP